MISPRIAARAALLLGTSLALAACSYDYMQHTDRVAYSAGDAVQANLIRETTNPSDRAMYDTGGLGKNGNVMPLPK